MCLSAIIVGLGKQRRVGKINILIYYFVGVPLGCVLVFVAKVEDGGFWIGLAVAFVLVNALYLIVYNTTNFETVSQEIAARYAMQKVMMDDEDSRRDSVEEDMLAGHYSVNRANRDNEGLLHGTHRSDASSKVNYKR